MANTIRKVHPNFHGKKGLSGRKRSPGTVMKYLTEKIDDNWPRLVDALIEKALGGDKEMIQYCFDRRLGKPKVEIGTKVTGFLITADDYEIACRLAKTDETKLLKEGDYGQREAEGTSEIKDAEEA